MYSGIAIYSLIWIASSLIVFFCYKKSIGFHNPNGSIEHRSKMPIPATLLISLLFTLFNVYATVNSVAMGGDRQNYMGNFLGYRASPSIGLTFLMNWTHVLGGSLESLFYFTTFSCTFITLMAYRMSKKTDPLAFSLLCMTQYFLTTLTALKQSYTSAFAVVFLVLILEYNSKKSNAAALVCALLACLFHSTGYILIVLFIVVRIVRATKNVNIYLLFLFIVAIFFKRIILIAAIVIQPVLPSLAHTITAYFGPGGISETTGSSTAWIFGMPYYYITILGIIKNKDLEKKIPGYDEHLFIVGIGAFFLLMSTYSEWLARFVYLFSFSSMIFFSELMKTIQIEATKKTYTYLLAAMLLIFTYRFLYLIYTLYGGF